MKSVEQRLATLEELIYFHEQTIGDLNDALTSQRFQIDEMQKMMEAMKKRLRTIAPLLEDKSGGNDDGPPPHYGTF